MPSEDDSSKCPHCKIKLVWGLPTGDAMDKVLDAVDRGEAELMGCEILENNYCPRCGGSVPLD